MDNFPDKSIFIPKRPEIFIIACISLFLLVANAYIFNYEFSPHEDTIVFDEAVFTPLDVGCPAPVNSNADIVDSYQQLNNILPLCRKKYLQKESTKVQLPHSLKVEHGWYRVTKNFSENIDDLWSVVIPKANMNIALLINNQLVDISGEFTLPYQRHGRTTHRFDIAGNTLKQGSNTIDIYLVSKPVNRGFLGKLYLGRREYLDNAFKLDHFIRFTLLQIIVITSLTLSCYLILLWSYRLKDVEYGLFGLSILFWSLNSFTQLIIRAPVSPLLWDWLFYVSACFTAIAAIFFIHRLHYVKRPKLEFWVLSVGITTSIFLLFLNEEWLHRIGSFVWFPFCYSLSVYAFGYVLWYSLKNRRYDYFVLLIAGLVALYFYTHDLAVIMGFLPWSTGLYTGYAEASIIIAFSGILLKRYILSLNRIEESNQELKTVNTKLNRFNQALEERVEEKGKEIRKSYQLIQQMEKEKVLSNERTRLMHDMHDGMGMHLATISHQLENETVDTDILRQLADDALVDLRLVIDSVGPSSKDVGTVLGMFRSRVTPCLNANNIELEWELSELLNASSRITQNTDEFGPEKALNLLRFMQEAVANIIKHAQASEIVVKAESVHVNSETKTKISISDNGQGIPEDNVRGHGLNNMEHRAKALEGHLEIVTGASSGIGADTKGTEIILTFPS